MIKILTVLVLGLLLVVSCVSIIQKYEIPTLVNNDYNCETHPGIISDSNPFFFETSQHYINRKNQAIQKQIEEACN